MLCAFLALAAGFHLFFVNLAAYKVVWYDEAVPGLMALQILRGEFPVFYWGAPYLGSLESLVAALLFALFGVSTLALRFSPLIFFGIYAVFVYKLGQRVTKQTFPPYVALFLAVPPLVLNEYSVSPVGGYIHTVALGTVLLYLTSRLLEDDGRENRTLLYALIGLVAGVGFWTFMMIVPYIFACLLCLLLRERRAFIGARTALLAVCFLVGSLPFWAWNARHDFLSFGMKAGVAAPGALKSHVANFIHASAFIMGSGMEWFTRDFDHTVSRIIAAVCLFAGLALVVNARATWVWFVAGLRRPDTLHLVAACFVASAGAFIFSSHGSRGLARYLLPLYSTLPLLMAHLFAVLSARSRLWHLLFVPLVLAMTLPSNAAFIAHNLANPYRGDLTELVRFLGEHGITHAYADFRVAQPISFESKERVVCADFRGFRNVEYLRRVDAAAPAAVAVITHADLKSPAPADMEEQVRALTYAYRKEAIGAYTVFYGFDLPDYAYCDRTPLVANIATNSDAAAAARMADMNVGTVWKSTNAAGAERHEIVVELEQETTLAKVSVLWARPKIYLRGGMVVEVSPDGEQWVEIKRVQRIFGPFQAFRGRPKLIDNNVTELLFEPVRCRFVRVTEAAKGDAAWEIAELGLFERTGVRRPLRPEEAAIALRTIGASFLMAEPWLVTELGGGRGRRPRAISTSRDEYNRPVSRPEERLPDFGAGTTFIVPARSGERVERLIAARGVPYERSRIGELLVLKAQAAASRQPPSVEISDWAARTTDSAGERSWSLRGDLGASLTLDGFELPNAGGGGAATFTVALSEDGHIWRQPGVQTNEALFWTDYSLLEGAPGPTTGVFDAPLAARYVELTGRGTPPAALRLRFSRSPDDAP